MRLVAASIGSVLLVGFVTACGSEDNHAPTSAVSLEDQPWVLVSGVRMPEDLADAAPSATFVAEQVSGSTGCNRYTAAYALDGDSLEITDIATTRMACPPPADGIEHAYVEALEQVRGWRAADENLVLVGADDAELLRFAAAIPVGSWQLTGLLRDDAFTSPIEGADVTAVFADDGELSGSAGCNTYTASYTVDLGAMEISPPSATEKACAAPAGVMGQETAYLALLEQVTSFAISGGTLELFGNGRTRLATFAVERP